MKAIILAAGINSRLKDEINVPKCLLKFGDKTLLERQIKSLLNGGLRLDDIFVVVGHMHEMIRAVHSNVIMNEKYAEYDNAYSLYLGLKHLAAIGNGSNEQVIILDGDLVYDEKLIDTVTKSNKQNLFVTREIRYSINLKDEIFLVDENNKTLEMRIPTPYNPLGIMYKDKKLFTYCGIARLSFSVAMELKNRLEGNVKGWYTIPIVGMVNDENSPHDFYVLPVSKSLKFCFDVDTKSDCEMLNALVESAEEELTTRRYTMFTAGPVNVSDAVKESMSYPEIGHREPEFSKLLNVIQNKLLSVFKADPINYATFVIGGSGTAAMESVLSASVHDGKKMLVISNGGFGERMTEICNVYQLDIKKISYQWGQYPNLEDIERELQTDLEIETVSMVFLETSTGMVNPVHEVGMLCKKYGKIFIVDAISALGGEDLDVVRDNIDFCFSNTNKCLGGLPAISFVCAKKTTIEKIRDIKPRNYYLDFIKHYDSHEKQKLTPYTPLIPFFFMLNQALDEVPEEGLDKRIFRYKINSALLRQNLRSLGFKFQLTEDQMSNVMTNVLIPKNYTYDFFHQKLKELGYIIYPGKDPLKDKVMHIANVGTLQHDEIQHFCNACQTILEGKKPEY